MNDPTAEDPEWFAIVSVTFVVIFIVEIIVRMIALRWKFLCGPHWRWNFFDLSLVLYSVTDEFLHEQFEDLVYIRILRVFRMVRVFRVIRLMTVFHQLRLMCCSIVSSLGAFCWAMVLLLFIMYFFTVTFMHAAIHHVREGNQPSAALVQHY